MNIVALSHIVHDLAAMSSMDLLMPERRATVAASLGVTSMSSAKKTVLNAL